MNEDELISGDESQWIEHILQQSIKDYENEIIIQHKKEKYFSIYHHLKLLSHHVKDDYDKMMFAFFLKNIEKEWNVTKENEENDDEKELTPDFKTKLISWIFQKKNNPSLFHVLTELECFHNISDIYNISDISNISNMS